MSWLVKIFSSTQQNRGDQVFNRQFGQNFASIKPDKYMRAYLKSPHWNTPDIYKIFILDYMSLSSRTETNDLIIFFEVLGVLVGFWTRGFCTLGGFLLPQGFLYRIIPDGNYLKIQFWKFGWHKEAQNLKFVWPIFTHNVLMGGGGEEESCCGTMSNNKY